MAAMASQETSFTATVLDTVSGVGHAFFTRRGGVSEGPYASLNCGFGSGDSAESVAANRARAMERLALSGDALVTVRQTHSADVAVVEAPWAPAGAPGADALVTRVPGVALGVLTADCAPVLFAEVEAGVIGAAHAGWRGGLAGVLEATIEAMTGLGADARRIVAGIGPCIHQQSYEVGPEFRATFVGGQPANGEFFLPGDGDRLLFDLPGYLERRLAAIGLGTVERLAHDTRGEEDLFFSYRRATGLGEARYGRGLSAIALTGG
jgi:YfiH family protein